MAWNTRGRKAMRSILVSEAIEEYRTFNRAQSLSPHYIASRSRNLLEFARWLAEEGRSDRIADLAIDDARAFPSEDIMRLGAACSPAAVLAS